MRPGKIKGKGNTKYCFKVHDKIDWLNFKT